MRTFSRRWFLRVLSALVAFVPVAWFLARRAQSENARSVDSPPAPHPTPPPPPPPSPPPGTSLRNENFRSGVVTSLGPDTIVLKNREVEAVLHLSPATRVWEGFWVKDMPVEIGDWVDAWGEPQADGSLVVADYVINLVNIYGPIFDIEQGTGAYRFQLLDRRGKSYAVVVEPRTEVSASGRARSPLGDSPLDLYEGQHIQVVGRRLKDGTILAVHLLLN